MLHNDCNLAIDFFPADIGKRHVTNSIDFPILFLATHKRDGGLPRVNGCAFTRINLHFTASYAFEFMLIRSMLLAKLLSYITWGHYEVQSRTRHRVKASTAKVAAQFSSHFIKNENEVDRNYRNDIFIIPLLFIGNSLTLWMKWNID